MNNLIKKAAMIAAVGGSGYLINEHLKDEKKYKELLKSQLKCEEDNITAAKTTQHYHLIKKDPAQLYNDSVSNYNSFSRFVSDTVDSVKKKLKKTRKLFSNVDGGTNSNPADNANLELSAEQVENLKKIEARRPGFLRRFFFSS